MYFSANSILRWVKTFQMQTVGLKKYITPCNKVKIAINFINVFYINNLFYK